LAEAVGEEAKDLGLTRREPPAVRDLPCRTDAAARDCAHARHELVRCEWLDEVVVASEEQPCHTVERLGSDP